MRTSNLWTAVAIGGVFFIVSLLSFGCGNPEAPQITNVRLSYWDSIIPDPEDPDWAPDWVPHWVTLDGDEAPQSPVRFQGNITDNTAVVNPRITWIGERGDVSGFTECSEGTRDLYECEMECEGPTPDGYFECTPAFDAQKLIRGDQFLLTGTGADGGTFKLGISVSESQELDVLDVEVKKGEDDEEIEKIIDAKVATEYRILRVSSLEGDAGFVWSVYQSTTGCKTWNPEEEKCEVTDASSDWRGLRSGDNLCWDPATDNEMNCSFQIAMKQVDGDDIIDSVNATWSSLTKWNGDFFLNWDARTGDFVEEFQIFDPRDPQDVSAGVGAATYRYVASAEDVPDQKTEEFRYSQAVRELIFSPEAATQEPNLEVDGEDEELVQTSVSAENINGTVKSFRGEVRSLAFRLSSRQEEPELSDEQEEPKPRFLFFNPTGISLLGEFTTTMVYVSDWDGDGVVDEWNEEEGIPNTLDAVALDVQGNWTYTTVPIVFLPSTATDGVPDLQVLEIYPALDEDGQAALPFGEELRVRARAADDRGQPGLSDWECHCVAEEPLINADRCPCELLGTGELNAGGQYPQNPWEWIVVEPVSETRESIGVLRATEKVDEEEDRPEAKFSGIEIDLEPKSEEDVYKISVSLPEISGPNVILTGLTNGDIVDPNGLIVQATIFANVSELNQIKALWNGQARGKPEFNSETGQFSWLLDKAKTVSKRETGSV